MKIQSSKRIDDQNYFEKYSFKLRLNDETKSYTHKLYYDLIDDHIFDGKSRKTIICACIYYAGIMTNNKLTQEIIATKIKITAVSLRKRLKDIYKWLEENDDKRQYRINQ